MIRPRWTFDKLDLGEASGMMARCGECEGISAHDDTPSLDIGLLRADALLAVNANFNFFGPEGRAELEACMLAYMLGRVHPQVNHPYDEVSDKRIAYIDR